MMQFLIANSWLCPEHAAVFLSIATSCRRLTVWLRPARLSTSETSGRIFRRQGCPGEASCAPSTGVLSFLGGCPQTVLSRGLRLCPDVLACGRLWFTVFGPPVLLGWDTASPPPRLRLSLPALPSRHSHLPPGGPSLTALLHLPRPPAWPSASPGNF